MLRYLPVLVILLAGLWALVECLQTPSAAVRLLPKPVWVLAILVFPLVGAIGWFVLGRPDRYAPGISQQQRWEDDARRRGHKSDGRNSPKRPKGPDDDPDFLRNL